jgi:hypothetical protein
MVCPPLCAGDGQLQLSPTLQAMKQDELGSTLTAPYQARQQSQLASVGRHGEPSDRRFAPSARRLREAIQSCFKSLDRFFAIAPRNDER